MLANASVKRIAVCALTIATLHSCDTGSRGEANAVLKPGSHPLVFTHCSGCPDGAATRKNAAKNPDSIHKAAPSNILKPAEPGVVQNLCFSLNNASFRDLERWIFFEGITPPATRVTLHRCDKNGAEFLAENGMEPSAAKRAPPRRYHDLPIRIPPGEHTFHISLVGNGPLAAHLRITDRSGFMKREKTDYFLFGLYGGLSFFVLFFVLFAPAGRAVRVSGAIFIASMGFFNFDAYGLLHEFGWFSHFPGSVFFSGLLAYSLALIFSFLFLEIQKTNVFLRVLFGTIFSAYAVGFASLLFMKDSHLWNFLIILNPLTGLILFCTGLYQWFRGFTGVRFYLLAFSFSGALSLNAVLSLIGVTDMNISIQTYFIASILEMIFFGATIADRYIHQQFLLREAREKLQEERYRIARDIHDSVGSDLTHMIARSRTLTDDSGLHDLARRTLEKIKDIVYLLRNPEDNQQTLSEFMLENADSLRQSRLYTIDTELDSGILISDLRERIHLKRIFSEWLSNTIRHSRPRNIRIVLRQGKRHVYIAVQDDGIGFRWNGKARSNGLGNIAERARLARASVAARPRDKGGTLFVTRIKR